MHFGNMGVFVGFGMLLFWIVFIFVIIWLIKQIDKKGENSIDILKKRYARGEISKKQFDQVKKELC